MSDAIDWDELADRMLDIQRAMVHDENWQGPGFYAEMLRRTFRYTPAGEPNEFQRVLSYEQVCAPGLVTKAEADHVRDGHTIVDRINREKAEEQVKEMRAEVARVYAEARKDVAEAIRNRCNERTVPAKLRREGVLLAADWIDPAVPKDRYGNIVRPDAAA